MSTRFKGPAAEVPRMRSVRQELGFYHEVLSTLTRNSELALTEATRRLVSREMVNSSRLTEDRFIDILQRYAPKISPDVIREAVIYTRRG